MDRSALLPRKGKNRPSEQNRTCRHMRGSALPSGANAELPEACVENREVSVSCCGCSALYTCLQGRMYISGGPCARVRENISGEPEDEWIEDSTQIYTYEDDLNTAAQRTKWDKAHSLVLQYRENLVGA